MQHEGNGVLQLKYHRYKITIGRERKACLKFLRWNTIEPVLIFSGFEGAVSRNLSKLNSRNCMYIPPIVISGWSTCSLSEMLIAWFRNLMMSFDAIVTIMMVILMIMIIIIIIGFDIHQYRSCGQNPPRRCGPSQCEGDAPSFRQRAKALRAMTRFLGGLFVGRHV